jgi:hypothetical protein
MTLTSTGKRPEVRCVGDDGDTARSVATRPGSRSDLKVGTTLCTGTSTGTASGICDGVSAGSTSPRSSQCSGGSSRKQPCEPRRPADFAGVVTGLGRGADRWTVSLESDSGDTRHRAGEPMTLYLSSRQARGVRVGCQVRAWFTNGGMALLSYPGQAWAEALRIDACPADAARPSRPAA